MENRVKRRAKGSNLPPLSYRGAGTPMPQVGRRPAWQPNEGDRFDRLVAVEPRGRSERGKVVWLFRCDCGEEVTWPVLTARGNARNGFCACPACYRYAHPAELFGC